jgi:hypothetical protein
MITAISKPKHAPEEYLHRVVPGFTRRDLAKLFAEKGYAKGAEIGVADGRYSLTLCQEIPGLQLLCVDPWAKYPGNPRGGPQTQHDANYALAQQRLHGFDVEFIRNYSHEAVKALPEGALDFVYIDGNHQENHVSLDLSAWSRRVRSGGIVSGHDFYHFGTAGVVQAVTEYVTGHDITDWHLCDEREPSFWWVKP